MKCSCRGLGQTGLCEPSACYTHGTRTEAFEGLLTHDSSEKVPGVILHCIIPVLSVGTILSCQKTRTFRANYFHNIKLMSFFLYSSDIMGYPCGGVVLETVSAQQGRHLPPVSDLLFTLSKH